MAVAAITAVACSKNEKTESASIHPNSFSVAMADLQNGNETKTGLIEEGGQYNKLVWAAGDQLYITTSGEIGGKGGTSFNYATYVTSDSGTTVANFSKKDGSIEIPGTGDYVAIYSGACDYSVLNGYIFRTATSNYIQAAIPVNQVYVENGIAPNAMPMYAYGDDLNNLNFKLLGNVLRFNLYNGDGSKVIKIKSIELTAGGSSSHRGIAGAFGIHVTMLDQDPSSNTGVWITTASSNQGSDHINYSCGSGITLSTDDENPTAFNVVISRTNPTPSDEITARFTYSVNDGADTYKDIVLTNFDQTKREALGKIYTFTPAKDVASW